MTLPDKKGSNWTKDWSSRFKHRFLSLINRPKGNQNPAQTEKPKGLTYADLWDAVNHYDRLWLFSDKLQSKDLELSIQPDNPDAFDYFLYDIKPFLEHKFRSTPDARVTQLALLGDMSMYLFGVDPVFRETADNRYLALRKVENMYVSQQSPKAFPLLDDLLEQAPALR